MNISLSKAKIYFLLVLITFITASCEEDDAAKSSDITGLWTVSSASIEMNVGDKSLIQYLTDALGITETEAQVFESLFETALSEGFVGTIEFKSDNTYESKFGGDADSGTWELSSDGTKITLDKGTADEITLDIISISDNTMKVGFSEEEQEDLDSDGMNETISINIELTLGK
ncbi:lipocalin-like domain-containing protein [Bacteroidota bacterium]